MYYLLEDNRIIYSMDIKYFDLCERYGFLVEVLDETVIKNLGKIKKQSENVFDLIDWTKDLVGINACGEFLIINCKTARSEFSDGYYYFNWIKTIYKPNSKGDYIKVWEKKEDEKED